MGVVARVIALGVLAIFAGCASVEEGNRDTSRAPSEFEDVKVNVKNLGPGYLRQGVEVAPTALAQIVPGMSKSDVRGLLGNPADETSQQWWFYNINLPLDTDGDHLVCQYRVAFSASGQVSNTQWRRPQCKSLYEALAGADVEDIALSSDVLFAYDSAELSSQGMRELDLAADVMASKMKKIDRIVVVGHSDRIGPDRYNNILSTRRAEAVRNYLISRGINDYLVSAEGRGAAEPVVQCPGAAVTAALKQCLQPNRRVQITIYGQR